MNDNLAIFESLVPVFRNVGMRLDIEKVKSWLEYNYTHKSDLTYEEFLGNSGKIDLNKAFDTLGKVYSVYKDVKKTVGGR